MLSRLMRKNKAAALDKAITERQVVIENIPDQCDNEVFKKGQLVYRLAGLPPPAIEGLIIRIRRDTGARVDWHFAGGIAQVLVLGTPDDRAKVRKAFDGLNHLMLQSVPEGDGG